jgi:hypothetical protein
VNRTSSAWACSPLRGCHAATVGLGGVNTKGGVGRQGGVRCASSKAAESSGRWDQKAGSGSSSWRKKIGPNARFWAMIVWFQSCSARPTDFRRCLRRRSEIGAPTKTQVARHTWQQGSTAIRPTAN